MRWLKFVAAIAALCLLAWLAFERGPGRRDEPPPREKGPEVKEGPGGFELAPSRGARARGAVGVVEPSQPSEETAAAKGTVAIIAESEAGERVLAAITLENEEGVRLLGWSHPTHSLRLNLEDLAPPARIVAVSESTPQRSGERVLDARPAKGDQIVVEVGIGCSIRGTIDMPPGRSVPQELRVVAVDTLRRSARSLTPQQPPSPDGTWSRTSVQPDGTFVLTGLREGRLYALQAAGGGWFDADPDPFRRYECSERDVRLPVRAVYGGVVRFADPELGRFVSDCSRAGLDVVRVSARSVNLTDHMALLGTQLVEEVRAAHEANERVITVPGDGEPSETIEASIATKLPGRPSHTETLQLRRIRDSLPDVLLDPDVTVGPRGSLQIWVLASPEPLAALHPSTVIGSLDVRPASEGPFGSAERTRVPIRAAEALEGKSLAVLPVGSYRWRFGAHGTPLLPRSGSSGIIEVNRDGASLVLDLTWTGSVELHVSDPDGIAVRSPLQVDLLDLASRSVTELPGGVELRSYGGTPSSMAWSAPPYVAPFVPPGSYAASTRAGFNRRLTGTHDGPIDVRAGELTEVSLLTTRF